MQSVGSKASYDFNALKYKALCAGFYALKGGRA